MSVNILLMKCTGGKWGVGASGRKKRLGTTSLDGCRHLLSKGTTKTQSSPKSLEVFVQYILLVCAMRVQIIVGGGIQILTWIWCPCNFLNYYDIEQIKV